MQLCRLENELEKGTGGESNANSFEQPPWFSFLQLIEKLK